MALLKHKDYDGEYPVKLAFDLRFRRDEPQDGTERFGAEVGILLGDKSTPTFQQLQATLLDLSADLSFRDGGLVKTGIQVQCGNGKPVSQYHGTTATKQELGLDLYFFIQGPDGGQHLVLVHVLF